MIQRGAQLTDFHGGEGALIIEGGAPFMEAKAVSQALFTEGKCTALSTQGKWQPCGDPLPCHTLGKLERARHPSHG